jgi:hypothetical protein
VLRARALAAAAAVGGGRGRTVTLHHRSSTPHQIYEENRCLYSRTDDATGP